MTAFEIIGRRKVSVVVVGILLSCVMVAAASRLKHSYVATASVLIQDRKSAVIDIQTAGTVASDSVAVRTQADILHSPGLAAEVVERLDLASRPEFTDLAIPVMQRILQTLRAYDPTHLLAKLVSDETQHALRPDERVSIAVSRLMGMTSIVNDGRSYVVDIKVKTSETDRLDGEKAARLSAELANGFAETYTQFTSKIKSDTIRRTNSFFDDRIAALQQKLRLTEDAVQRYRQDHGLVEDRAASSDNRAVSINSQQLAQLNSDLVSTTADRENKQAILAQVTRARSDDASLAAMPDVLASPVIQQLRSQQAELGAKDSSLAVSQGPRSPDLLAVRGSERDVARQISTEIGKVVVSLRAGVDAARAKQEALTARLTQLQTQVGVEGQAEIKLRELQNEADVARAIYSSYLRRWQETSEQLDVQEPDALVVSRASIPLGPSPPSTKQLAVLGVGAAWVLSLLLALIRERMRTGFRTAEQFEVTSGVSMLGLIPHVRNPGKAMLFDAPGTAFSEAILSVRSLLRLALPAGSHVVMVTSALPREGKTYFCSALARNAAIAGERVLLVDCDLRRPSIAKAIGFAHSDSMDGVTVQRDVASSLDVLGFNPSAHSPSDLFASVKMRDLLKVLRKEYSLIVLDTPPVLAVSDARVLSGLADATVLVVKWQETPRKLVASALAQLRSSGARIAGSVMQQVKLSDLTQADGAVGYVYRRPSPYLSAKS